MGLTLTTIILAEVIFALLLGIAFLVVVNRRITNNYKRLLEEYQRQLRTIRVNPNTTLQQSATFDKSEPDSDHSLEYFLDKAASEAKARYTAMTQAKVPRLAADQPFGAKVAALRHLYLTAEADLLKKRKSPHESWILLERKLYDAVRWIVDREQSRRSVRNNQVRLMQQRIDALKKYEGENKDLRRKLYLHKLKQERLTDDMAQNQQTIDKLQKINESLQQALAHQVPSNYLQQASLNFARSENQLHNIRDMSAQKQRITDELTLHLQSINHPGTELQRQKLTLTIKALERNLQSSSSTISNLQKQLDAAQALLERKSRKTDKQDEDYFYSAEHKTPENRELHARQNAWEQGGGHQQTIADILQLRENNQRQRNIIIELEKELRGLRQALMSTAEEEPTENRTKEIDQLEKLIKECEYCIDTLESEVDMLQEQLQLGIHTEKRTPAFEHKMQDDAITQLNHELDLITSKLEHTLAQHKTDSVIRRLAIEILEMGNVETIARRLVLTLRELQISAGFYINCDLGKAEFFPPRLFTTHDRDFLKESAASAPISYLNEGILFSTRLLHLMLKDPPEAEQEQTDLETTLTALVGVVGARINFLQTQARLQVQTTNAHTWVSATRELLTNLDMRYAERAEKAERVIKGLLAEIKNVASVVEMSDKTEMVFNNALNECQAQLRVLFASDATLDQDYEQLLEQLDKLVPPSSG